MTERVGFTRHLLVPRPMGGFAVRIGFPADWSNPVVLTIVGFTRLTDCILVIGIEVNAREIDRDSLAERDVRRREQQSHPCQLREFN